jgi:hypothetical protein
MGSLVEILLRYLCFQFQANQCIWVVLERIMIMSLFSDINYDAPSLGGLFAKGKW